MAQQKHVEVVAIALTLVAAGAIPAAAGLPGYQPAPSQLAFKDGVYPNDPTMMCVVGMPHCNSEGARVPADQVVELNGFYVRNHLSSIQFVWTSPHSFNTFPNWALVARVHNGFRTITVTLARNGPWATQAYWASTSEPRAHHCYGATMAVAGGSAQINVPVANCLNAATYGSSQATFEAVRGRSTITFAWSRPPATSRQTPFGVAAAEDDVNVNGRMPSISYGYPVP